jgi:hypothetical protein
MVKKVALHTDALAGIVLVFAASFGFNVYQRFQYESLLQEHTALQWKAQNTEVNWKYVVGKLKKCQAAAQARSPAKDLMGRQ